MFTNPEQFASATKTLFELQMMTFNALTSKAVQGVQQVVALNMSTAKDKVEELRTFSNVRGTLSYQSLTDGNDTPGEVSGVSYTRGWTVSRYV